MKTLPWLILIILLQVSCSTGDKTTEQDATAESSNFESSNKITKDIPIDPAVVLKDFMSWYRYTMFNIKLAQDFIPRDVNSLNISKENFLKEMLSSRSVPLWIKVENGVRVYKLFPLNNLDKDIVYTVHQFARDELNHMSMEGKKFPEEALVDLRGTLYDRKKTIGKTVVVKCWFIACVPCVQEFPVLNQLVDDNSKNDKILFISLAMDSPQQLSAFLKKKPFKYAVIPNKKNLMVNIMKIKSYPTHLVLDGEGTIKKVVGNAEDLLIYLGKVNEKM